MITSSSDTAVPVYIHVSKLSSDLRQKIHSQVTVENNYSWVRGSLLSASENELDNEKTFKMSITCLSEQHQVEIIVKGSENENNFFLLANQELSNVTDDLVNLTHLHEPAVVETLSCRYKENLIYTAIGPILLALNPFRSIAGLYNENAIQEYRDGQENKKKPHVYRTANAAYRSMMRAISSNGEKNEIGDKPYQSILVSGESGAGKTMTTRFIMNYLAQISFEIDNHHLHESKMKCNELKTIAQKILQSNPILESFGNARTIRNDNSSRFGKFIEIHFEKGSMIGASIETYLLEKVRLVSQSIGERNYHIFYELLSSLNDVERMRYGFDGDAQSAEDYILTNQSGTYDRRDGVNDSDSFSLLSEAMLTMGFSSFTFGAVKEMIAAIMHLGNIAFYDDENENSAVSGKSAIFHLQCASRLLGVSLVDLRNALTMQTIRTPNEQIISPLNSKSATFVLQALYKGMYKAIFDFIVNRVNRELSHEAGSTGRMPINEPDSSFRELKNCGTIGILDIFGFESFEKNSFEQLCINYANETLQHQFNSYILGKEQTLYKDEGIIWEGIKYDDNLEVLETFASGLNSKISNVGLFDVLDEQCQLPKTTDGTFYNALHRSIKKNSRKTLTISNLQYPTRSFSINHYAGRVNYMADGFLMKNQDSAILSHDLLQLFQCKCDNDFIKDDLLPVMTQVHSKPIKNMRKTRNRRNMSVSAQFREQLQLLQAKINRTTPHYIRCLKPNNTLVPDCFDRKLIAHQLRCAGVLEAVRISRLGYPQRYSHNGFVKRYKMLKPSSNNAIDTKIHSKQIVHLLVSYISEHTSTSFDLAARMIQMGKSKIFLQGSAFHLLESYREEKIKSSAVKIQALIKGLIIRRIYLQKLSSILRLQCAYRKAKSVKVVKELRRVKSALIIQTSYRCFKERRDFNAVQFLAQWTQRYFNGRKGRKIYQKILVHAKVVVLQCFWRMISTRRNFLNAQTSAVVIQSLFRKVSARCKLRRLRLEAKDLFHIQDEYKKLKVQLLLLKQKAEETDSLLNEVTRLKEQCVAKDVEISNLRKESIMLRLCQNSNNDLKRSIINRSCGEKDFEIYRQQPNPGACNDTAYPRKTVSVQTIPSFPKSLLNDDEFSGVVSSNSNKLDAFKEDNVSIISTTSKVTVTEQIIDEKDNLIFEDERGTSPESPHSAIVQIIATTNEMSIIRMDDRKEEEEKTVSTGYSIQDSRNLNITSIGDDCEGGISIDSHLYYNIPLHLAVCHCDLERVEDLIKDGSDLNATDDLNGYTPLHLAVRNHLGDRQLLEENAVVTSSSTLEHICGKIIALLCSAKGVNINLQDFKGNTPLHFAAMSNLNDDGVGINSLLENGADPSLKNHQGLTPLHLLCNNKRLQQHEFFKDIFNLFLKNDANVNVRSKSGCTPLHLALINDDIDTCLTLVHHGAQLSKAWKRSEAFDSLLSITPEKLKLFGTEESKDSASNLLPWDLMKSGTDRLRIINAIKTVQHSSDSKNDSCMICRSKLYKVGKHHCRNCGRCVCRKCSPAKLSLEDFPAEVQSSVKESKERRKKGHRACLECERILSFKRSIEQKVQRKVKLGEKD